MPCSPEPSVTMRSRKGDGSQRCALKALEETQNICVSRLALPDGFLGGSARRLQTLELHSLRCVVC
jgi:hypothetical protein